MTSTKELQREPKLKITSNFSLVPHGGETHDQSYPINKAITEKCLSSMDDSYSSFLGRQTGI